MLVIVLNSTCSKHFLDCLGTNSLLLLLLHYVNWEFQMEVLHNFTTKADFLVQWHQLLWFTPQFKAISECRQKTSFKKTLPQSCPETSAANSHLVWAKGGLREVMCSRRKKKGKSKVLFGGFCLHSEAEQRALQKLHICCS